ncbi:MAG: hypothetical protein ACXV5L_04200 [Thermoanaerobaculia bacterium]
MHLADYCENPVPGRIQVQQDPNAMPLCAERAYFLDERAFTSASMVKDRIGAPALNLCFSDVGRNNFQRVISANRGRWVVFLTHGKLLMAAIITATEPIECATVEGSVNSEELSELQRSINQR